MAVLNCINYVRLVLLLFFWSVSVSPFSRIINFSCFNFKLPSMLALASCSIHLFTVLSAD